MQLARVLHSRGFRITFVITEFQNTLPIHYYGFNSVKALSDFRFETILPADFHPFSRTCLAPFIELIAKLNSWPDVPPISCIIPYGVMGFGVEGAKALGIPHSQFWIASACGFMACLQCSELPKRGLFPFKDENFISDGTLDKGIHWIPGMSNMRLKDLPTFIRTTDPHDFIFDSLVAETVNCLNSSAIIFNTFDEFEPEVLEAIAAKFPNICTVGPLSLLARHMPESKVKSYKPISSEKEESCLQWLNKWEPNSVVFVNYGTTAMMTEEQLKEFAWGLADSKHPFLWILRAGVVMGESAVLPEEFLDEIQERGLIASWCPQDEVLKHPSVGVFLSHCGWNSLTEAVCGGVPVTCWPFIAEQPTNARYACTTWGIGVEIDQDVKRREVEALVKEMIEGDEGKRLREKTLEWKTKAEAATDNGGSSYSNFEKLIKEVLGHRNL